VSPTTTLYSILGVIARLQSHQAKEERAIVSGDVESLEGRIRAAVTVVQWMDTVAFPDKVKQKHNQLVSFPLSDTVRLDHSPC
jgi:exonuclease III